MAEVFRGLYRTIAWAYVTNGTMAFQVPEADNRAFGYEPHYDNLPWKELPATSTSLEGQLCNASRRQREARTLSAQDPNAV